MRLATCESAQQILRIAAMPGAKFADPATLTSVQHRIRKRLLTLGYRTNAPRDQLQ